MANDSAYREGLLKPADPTWSLRSRIDNHPMTWMIQVNGFLVDARFLKREIQEEALRKGLMRQEENQRRSYP
jgi:hypothetical protein